MDTSRLEIQRGGEWKALDLKQFTSIKYNKVINKIGKVGTREISHSNTFSLPISHNNTGILGLNSFNYNELALALNRKSVARYFINDKVTQVGFVIINNMDNNSININFIDGALDIVDKWGEISFLDFLQSSNLTFPTDYATALDEMREYSMNKSIVLPHLTDVGTRGYSVGLFPNNLNCIGEKWQVDLTGERMAWGTFNPYQSRTIWNTKAFLDLIIETYGYTPTYDVSVDWDNIEKTYFTSTDALKNEEGGQETSVSNSFVGFRSTLVYDSKLYGSQPPQSPYQYFNVFQFSGSQARKPNTIPNWSPPLTGGFYNTNWDYEDTNCIYVPQINNSTDGTIVLSAGVTGTSSALQAHDNNFLFMVSAKSDGTGVTYQDISESSYVTNNAANGGGFDTVDYTIQKTIFENTTNLIGIMLFVGTINSDSYQYSGAFYLSNMDCEEDSLLASGITYDEFGQYVPDDVDLTYSASKLTLKSILNSIMETKGLLIDINATTKDITLFSYGAYLDKIEAGEYDDWTNYLLEDEPIKYNTNYGNDYAIVNKIGLASPYLGNTFSKVLTNQGVDSKYKPFVEKYDQNFNDVVGVQEVINPNNDQDSFFEFETESISLVEDSEETHSSMVQRRADTSSPGNILNVPKIVNVNFAELPNGLNEWYNIIDGAVRVKASFLISPSVFVKFDIKQPIYLRQLGGYFIVEEVEEYESGDSPVKVTLIKLLRNISD